MYIHYRMNAGYLEPGHWVHAAGGRIVGEACHIVDLMTSITGARIVDAFSRPLRARGSKFSTADNATMFLEYEDGSHCTIDYLSLGSREQPKEYMEIHFDEKSIVMNDYKALRGYGVRAEMSSRISEKGQFEELECLCSSLLESPPAWPIEWWDMVQTTEVSFRLAS